MGNVKRGCLNFLRTPGFFYGFCYDVSPHPTVSRRRFPLYHRDRYDGRILELLPGKTYYVRIRTYTTTSSGTYYSSWSTKSLKVTTKK